MPVKRAKLVPLLRPWEFSIKNINKAIKIFKKQKWVTEVSRRNDSRK